jgi:hypothetical protein
MWEAAAILALLVWVVLSWIEEGRLRLGRMEPCRKYAASVKTLLFFSIAAVIVYHQDTLASTAYMLKWPRPAESTLFLSRVVLGGALFVAGVWLAIRRWPRGRDARGQSE